MILPPPFTPLPEVEQRTAAVTVTVLSVLTMKTTETCCRKFMTYSNLCVIQSS